MSAVPMGEGVNDADSDRAVSAMSAFMDGEQTDWPEGDTDNLRQDWDTYHLIGDVMRSEHLSMHVSDRFSRNLLAALEDELPIIAAPRRPVRRTLARYAMPGAALAIAVVAISWIAQPYIAPSGSVQANRTPPVNTFMASSVPLDPRLEDYFDAHRQMAGMGGITPVSLAVDQR